MDEIKNIRYDVIKEIVALHGFDADLMLKDYYITVILYLIRNIEGIYFKGGTALQKIFLNYSRLSEDIDFTVTKDLGHIKTEIRNILERCKLFSKITKDKDVEGFTRLVVHYIGFSNEEGVVFIDLNKRAKLLRKPEKYEIKHFYKENIPSFSINTLSKYELIAEKMVSAIARNMPRDHYDLYKIIKANMKIDITLVREKCKHANVELNIIKMFNKAKKLNRRWNEDLIPLLAEDISFEEVMRTLAKHFKLKDEKEKLMNK